MGDMGDMYREMKADKKAKGAKREAANLKIISDWMKPDLICGFPRSKAVNFVKNYGGTIGFRFPDRAAADFYPTKNKWRKGPVSYYGNAEKFLEWYEKN